jgi:hypothetical protein
MGRPKISEDQRVVAVGLLANAIRKEMRFKSQTESEFESQGMLAMLGSRGQREASRQYVRGMYDLLAVLFEGGRALADQCYLAAEADATGPIPPAPDR